MYFFLFKLDAAEKESQTSTANKWWLKLWEEMGKMEKKSLSSLSLSSFPEANIEAQVVEIVRLKQVIGG